MHLLSTTVKQELIRFLALAPEGATPQEVAATFQISRQAAQARISELEAAGVVVADTPRGERRGRVVRYRVDHGRLDDLLTAVSTYLHGR